MRRDEDLPEDLDELEDDDQDSEPEGEQEQVTEDTLESVRAGVRAELESEFQEHKKRFGARLKENLATLGLGVSEDGKPVFVDAQKAAVWNAMQSAVPGQAPEKEPEPATMPDPGYDPEGFRSWFDTELERRTEKRVAQLVEPLKRELESARGQIGRQAMPSTTQRAKELLEAEGLGAVADDPAFTDLLSQALSQVPQDQWTDDLVLSTSAMMTVPLVRARQRQEGRTNGTGQSPPPANRAGNETSARAAINRAGLEATTPSRAQNNVQEPDIPDHIRQLVELNRAAGIETSPEEMLAALDESGASLRTLVIRRERERNRSRR